MNNDGIDANHNIYIKGGTVLAYGTTNPEQGLDANTEEGYSLYINGGTVMAVGGGTTVPNMLSTQPSIIYGGGLKQGVTLALSSGSNAIAGFVMDRSYSGNVTVVLSSPSLTKGSSYKLSADGSTLGSVSSLASPYSTIGSPSLGMGGGRR